MEDEQFRRKVYGFLSLCIAVLTLIGLIIPIETVAYSGGFGNGMSNTIGLWFMGFKSDFFPAIIIGIFLWLQFLFAVVAIVLAVMSFKQLNRHSKLINKAVTLGGVIFTGIYFLMGLAIIIYNCIESRSYLSEFIFTSFSFVPFLLTVALLILMAKLNKKYGRQRAAGVKTGGASDMEKITEYKKLLDEGIISQEQFDQLKTKILYGEGLQK